LISRLFTSITDTVLVDIYLAAKYIGEILNTEFSYRSGDQRIRAMDNPEVLLASLVVVSTKLFYSLDGVERQPISSQDPRRTSIDWSEWQNIIKSKPLEHANLARGEEYKVTTDDVLNMSKAKVDDYIDWFEKMWLHDREPRSELSSTVYI
jgi:RNA polymerase I-specific transcription initiation factor RRN7